jgi:hypothetical protein
MLMRPDQERIAEWLSEDTPQLGKVYRGAIRLLNEPSFPGRHHFICHAGRDIGNRVPDKIADSKTERFEITNDVATLTTLWTDSGLDRIELASASLIAQEKSGELPGTLDITIPQSIFRQMQIIVTRHRQGSKNNRDRAIRMVEAVAPENMGRQEVLYPLATQWIELTKWFADRTHAGLKVTIVDEEELQNKFRALETYLGTLIGEFYGSVETLDDILEDTNS